MKEIKTIKGFKFNKNSDEDLIRNIKEYFENPKIFLKINNKIGIGKSSLRKRAINFTNNILVKSNNVIKSLKGMNINTENGTNLSSIPNLSPIQNSIKEESPPKDYIINSMNVSKEINNNEGTDSKLFNNYFLDSKKDNNNINYNNNDCIKIENNKQNQNLFNNKIGAINKKNMYCITEEKKNNGKIKKIRVLKISKDKKLLSKTKNNEKYNKENANNAEKRLINKKRIQSALINKNKKRPLSVNIHYQYKTSNEIIKYYILGKNREAESKSKGTNSLIPKEVQENTKKKYLIQEKNLKENIIHSYIDKNISHYLAKKCHKKEEDLLYNNIEDFRIKKQLLDYLENKKTLTERLGNNFWYINLRRPDHLKNPRGLFINIGNEEKKIWEPLVEFPLKNIEIIKKSETPHKENNNFEKFLKEKNLYPNDLFNPNKKNKEKARSRMPNLTDMNDMVIKGRNIISLEKENFLDNDVKLNLTKHKYRVFKDPREDNLKYSHDCLYKLDYKFEGMPFKTVIGVKKNGKNKTPKHDKVAHRFHSDKKKIERK